MDETRFGWPRWRPDGVHADGRIRWQRTDPWETGFVDLAGPDGVQVGDELFEHLEPTRRYLLRVARRAGVDVVVPKAVGRRFSDARWSWCSPHSTWRSSRSVTTAAATDAPFRI